MYKKVTFCSPNEDDDGGSGDDGGMATLVIVGVDEGVNVGDKMFAIIMIPSHAFDEKHPSRSVYVWHVEVAGVV